MAALPSKEEAGTCEGMDWPATAASMNVGLADIIRLAVKLAGGGTPMVTWRPLEISLLYELYPVRRWFPSILVEGKGHRWGTYRRADQFLLLDSR